MSVIRTRDLRRRGLTSKALRKKCRSYCRDFCAGNKKFAINNFSFHKGLNDKFTMQSI